MASAEEPAPDAAVAAEGDEATLLDDMEPRTPMKRLGSTRKLAAFSSIRQQLGEQTRVLEARAEATAAVAAELHDYCRRRADLEHEYSRALDKLARAAAARHREREPPAGAAACWRAALDASRALARDHGALGALYGAALAPRLARAADDAQRLHRKCRELLAERHEEVGAALAAAQARAKRHAAAHLAWRHAALKLRAALDARADPPRHRKLKALDKELDKRRARHAAARADALRARAEYALALDAANATLQRYYLDDVGDVILAMEVGFEAAVARCVRTAAAAEAARGAAAAGAGAAGALAAAAGALDALADRQRVLDAHAAAFALPRPLAPPPAGEAAAVEALLGEAGADAGADADAAVLAELAARLRQLDAAARALRAECRENAKTLDAAEDELVKQMEGSDSEWEVSGVFGAGGAGAAGVPAPRAPASDDQEDYYLAKFRAYVSCAGRLARVESKAAALRARLAGGDGEDGAGPPAPAPARALRRGRGRFAAPLELRLPRVLTECVRVVAAHGLRHQGVFRVSGSHAEMQALRAAFERGEEPLAAAGPADLNSVCGLLKLWLRECRPPLLPPQLQPRLVRLAARPADAAFCARLGATLGALPAPALLVLRYLFAFLAHLAEQARHTCMDAWNLAVCLGPTLLPAWGEAPHQLHAQNQLNELVKRTILLHDKIFPQDIAPHALYRRPGEAAPEGGEGGEDAGGAGGAEEARGALAAAAEEDAHALAADEPDAPDALADDSDTDGDSSDEAEPAPARRPGEESPQEPAPPPAPGPAPPVRRLADCTPDLVLDLPEPSPAPRAASPAPRAASPAPRAASPAPRAASPAPAAPAADAFAADRDTLRKRTKSRRASEERGAGQGGAGEAAGPGAPAGSPVPARNTARVAAKFAELTLTGGSLKPALAAKPALLRRPAPRAAPPPAPAPSAADGDV